MFQSCVSKSENFSVETKQVAEFKKDFPKNQMERERTYRNPLSDTASGMFQLRNQLEIN